MKKILLVPDSFKGTLSSISICRILSEEIRRVWPEALAISIPVADGGEGSVDAFLTAVGGERRTVVCQGPYGEPVEGFYGMLPGGTAVVEMAAAAGLPLAEGRLDPEKTSTYGVGQLIKAAAAEGAKKIIVGLGGSATNDGGAGAAAALGVRFLDEAGQLYVPTGGTLKWLTAVDASSLDPVLEGVELVTMCDIDNPLCGPTGASAVFGPQKGADPEMVQRLDANLSHLADIMARDLGKDLRDMPGAGAAGGMGCGMAGFLNSRLQMGIETVLDTVGFDELLADADLVITGEGRIDGQSLRGKVVIGVARRAKVQGVPVVAVVGDIGDDVEAAYDMGVTGIFSTNRVAIPFREAKGRAESDLRLTARNLMEFMGRMGL